MADNGGDVVANFMAITGADDAVAIQMLEAVNFNLEEAVQLFFASEGNAGVDHGPGPAAGGSASAGPRGGAGGVGQRSPAAPGHGNIDEGVRAPLPTKIERLYGDDFDPRPMYSFHGLSGRQQQQVHVDVFRDFRAESAAAATAALAAGATSSSPAAAPGTQGLSGLFKLPADLVFSGNAEMAMGEAAANGKWLLLNVQSATEFASHMLNRDTWSHEALKELLKGTFVFYQTHENSPDGRALIKAYKLDAMSGASGPCPAILVLDPLTGAKMWHRTGFIDAEKLMEELVPFMDHGPLDSGAANLAQSNLMRKATAAKEVAHGSTLGSAGLGAGAMTEDEELALAIAMSMEGGENAGGSGPRAAADEVEAAMDELDDLDEAAIWAHIQAAERAAAAGTEAGAPVETKSPEEVASQALARVPAEPSEGDPEAVRVALRMPDGTRVTRRFRRVDPVQVLFDFGLAHVPEAAAGRSLVISHAAPGGQVLTDPEQSLDAAGVAGAMLAIKLAD
ncbi:hypothetical protein VaNZ11_013750 [Volvox africanus]|uniref:UBX domain-containing protein n=1 Tax=Volvox africanus TaxID=51714 RepID=A0ABQ5SGY1_9CHLO|nr:hypothetical protein VaNZ11_013750 [Volvox africanus]